MHFDLVDNVVSRSEDRIVTRKQVSLAEEYLQDHFPGFPVLPGVMMLEAMAQAARKLLNQPRLVVGSVKALRYSSMVRPGEALQIEVRITQEHGDGSFTCKGAGKVHRPGEPEPQETAVSGKFTLRPVIGPAETKTTPSHGGREQP
jgi:3-hydroxyacyl-[acyl-carrier-protein] dehydratase